MWESAIFRNEVARGKWEKLKQGSGGCGEGRAVEGGREGKHCDLDRRMVRGTENIASAACETYIE